MWNCYIAVNRKWGRCGFRVQPPPPTHPNCRVKKVSWCSSPADCRLKTVLHPFPVFAPIVNLLPASSPQTTDSLRPLFCKHSLFWRSSRPPVNPLQNLDAVIEYPVLFETPTKETTACSPENQSQPHPKSDYRPRTFKTCCEDPRMHFAVKKKTKNAVGTQNSFWLSK